MAFKPSYNIMDRDTHNALVNAFKTGGIAYTEDDGTVHKISDDYINGGGGGGGNRLDDYDVVIRINTVEGEPTSLDVIKSDISAFERYKNDEIPVNIFVYSKTEDNHLISHPCDFRWDGDYVINAYTMYVPNTPAFVGCFVIIWDPEEETWFLD